MNTPVEPSEAERIAGLQRTIEAEEKRLKSLESELSDPDGEYARAEREFEEIDKELGEKKAQLQKLKQEGKRQPAAQLEKDLKSLEKQWKLAKDRFELAIEERRTAREEIATLKLKVQKDRDALDDLTGANEPDQTMSEPAPTHGTHKSSPTDHEGAGADAKAPGKPGSHGEDATSSSTGSAAHEASSKSAFEEGSETSDGPPDEELKQAQAEAKEKEEEAQEAKEEAQSIAGRIADLQKLIAQEQKVLALARKKTDLALATQQSLEEELTRKQGEGAEAEELQELRTGIAEAKDRYAKARNEVTESTDRLGDGRSELAGLQSQQIIVLQEAEKKRLDADQARDKVEELRNPFAPRNMLKWLIEHGPNLAFLLAGMVGLLTVSKMFSHRIIKLMVTGTGRGSAGERENRAQTLVGVFQNAASVTIFVGGTLMILDEMGAKVSVLLGGVAAVGLAVAFGAQNLIKDYFSGFVMLLENQYMVNDIVKIGDLTGRVERITLRMTVLRDGNGVAHFIPNGQINSVSNETHGWSRACFEVGVAYKEDVDRVILVLADLGRELCQDSTYGPMILEQPTTPAVDQLADSAVVLKFNIKTQPNQHKAVKSELLRRIKNRFDELGIDIPFPHRTIYYQYAGAVPVPAAAQEMKKCA